MKNIEYRALNQVNSEQLLCLLNKEKIRTHLMEHHLFDRESLQAWLNEKMKIDSKPGCRIRTVLVEEQCVGWCGIQEDKGNFEFAIILDDCHWGLGRKIFRDLMVWAKELGHQTVSIHFLHTRPEYQFLQKMAKSVYKSEIQGNTFTTYTLPVD